MRERSRTKEKEESLNILCLFYNSQISILNKQTVIIGEAGSLGGGTDGRFIPTFVWTCVRMFVQTDGCLFERLFERLDNRTIGQSDVKTFGCSDGRMEIPPSVL